MRSKIDHEVVQNLGTSGNVPFLRSMRRLSSICVSWDGSETTVVVRRGFGEG